MKIHRRSTTYLNGVNTAITKYFSSHFINTSYLLCFEIVAHEVLLQFLISVVDAQLL